MLSYDKIVANVPAEVIDTMKVLSKENNVVRLKSWLNDCIEEIKFRTEQKLEGIYSLQCEKAYLEMLLC